MISIPRPRETQVLAEHLGLKQVSHGSSDSVVMKKVNSALWMNYDNLSGVFIHIHLKLINYNFKCA